MSEPRQVKYPVTESDLTPLLRTLHDPSLRVRLASLRALVLLPMTAAVRNHVLKQLTDLLESIEWDQNKAETADEDLLRTALHEALSQLGNDSYSQPDDNVSSDAITNLKTMLPVILDPSEELIKAERAEQIADSILQDPDADVPVRAADTLRYLDVEEITMLINTLFLGLRDRAFDADQPYMAGNSLVTLIGGLGNHFTPDITALFEVYLSWHKYCLDARSEYYRTNNTYIFFFSKTGHLALSCQLAWAVSRAEVRQVIIDLTGPLCSVDEEERLAAIHLIEDVMRWCPLMDPPLFGGAPTLPEARTSYIVEADVQEPSQYRMVTLLYGVDRMRTGLRLPENFYGNDPAGAAFEFGKCKVSVPNHPNHKIGIVETPVWCRLEFRPDPSKHIVLHDVLPYSKSEFCDELRSIIAPEGQVVVFVHGYRVTFADAARRAAQLSCDLSMPTVLYSWASAGRFFSYLRDAECAKITIPRLLDFVHIIAAYSGATTVHLIAHSMGNVPLAAALQKFLGARGQPGSPMFREVVLAAPDVNATEFREQIAPAISGKGARVTLYASRNDRALLASRLHATVSRNLLFQRLGDARRGHICVLPNMDTIDASAVDTSFFGHSYFAGKSAVVNDIFYLLKQGLGPDKRFGMIKKNQAFRNDKKKSPGWPVLDP